MKKNGFSKLKEKLTSKKLLDDEDIDISENEQPLTDKQIKFEGKVNGILGGLKTFFKNPKVLLGILIVWYVETPIIIAFHNVFYKTSLLGLYINPIKLFWEFITTPAVIGDFIKLNLFFIIVFLITSAVMHLMGKGTGSIFDIQNLKGIGELIKGKEGEIKFSDRGDYGTARWATKESILKANKESIASHSDEYVQITKEGNNGLIFGYFGENVNSKNADIITLPKKTTLNRNCAVFGSSGSNLM